MPYGDRLSYKKSTGPSRLTPSIGALCGELKHLTGEARVAFLKDNGQRMIDIFNSNKGDSHIEGIATHFRINIRRLGQEVGAALTHDEIA